MIPLYRPYMPADLEEVSKILQSGQLAFGKWGRAFEKSIADFSGAQYVVSTNSYNSAMLLAITTLDIGHGDEVIASPMSCLASNQPFVTQGANVVWADIDPKRGTLDPIDVAQKITKSTKAIFHNHHCGYPGHIDEINAIGEEHGLPVVDDAIEAFGSLYKNRCIGNVGTPITVFSFETVRLPNCIIGGAVIFQDEEMYLKAKRIRDYGVNRANFRDEMGEINPHCDIELPGFGIKPAEINSYIGSTQMKVVPDLISKQRANGIAWSNWIEENSEDFELVDMTDIVPNFWVYGVLSSEKIQVIKKMRSSGFYASGVHLNNNNYSVFGHQDKLSGVDDFYDKFIALPSGWWVNSILE